MPLDCWLTKLYGASQMSIRGVAPDILISHVRNTIPFVFDEPQAWLARAPHLAPLLEPTRPDYDAFSYFRLCLAAHHATVSSFVPTDVDNQIRLRLWSPALDRETASRMAELVLESRSWDCRPLSARFVQSPVSGKLLSGHAGEWFSTAVAAFGSLRKKNPELAARVADEIRDEVSLEAEIFDDFVRARDGLNALRACTIIAHNLGDLQRVIEMWNMQNLPETDFARTGLKSLATATELNKAKMAAENHRHFALRKPRCLRKAADFLLPYGPFLDEWGARLARHPLLDTSDLGEIAEALIEGLERTPGSIGYTRALAGLESQMRGGAQALQNAIPAREARKLKAGQLRTLISIPKEQFERQWSQFAVQFCKTLPQASSR